MSLSVVIPWRGRSQIGMTVATFVREAEAIGGEVIVANHGGDTAQLSALLGAHANRVRIATIPSDGYFSKTCAMNVGGRLAHRSVPARSNRTTA